MPVSEIGFIKHSSKAIQSIIRHSGYFRDFLLEVHQAIVWLSDLMVFRDPGLIGMLFGLLDVIPTGAVYQVREVKSIPS
jgi:hypothetical protein